MLFRSQVFDISESAESPYMLIVAPVREQYRRALSEEETRAMKDPDLRKRVNVCRSEFPELKPVPGDTQHAQRCWLDEDTKRREAEKLLASTMAGTS